MLRHFVFLNNMPHSDRFCHSNSRDDHVGSQRICGRIPSSTFETNLVSNSHCRCSRPTRATLLSGRPALSSGHNSRPSSPDPGQTLAISRLDPGHILATSSLHLVCDLGTPLPTLGHLLARTH